jgi:sugar lactone lactonase YvrE
MLRLARRAGVVLTLLALGAATALGGSASATGGGLQVVASGLNNPRGIAIGPGGALFVAESGAGGSGPCTVGPEGNEVCFGPSGAITRIAHGTQRQVVTGLPSVADRADSSAAVGPVDVSFAGGRQYVLLGNPGGGPESREQFGPGAADFGRLLRVHRGKVRRVADFPQFEADNNPDGGAGAEPGLEIDSNPNGLLARHRSRLVTDAGGNDLLKVDAKGRVRVLAVFPPRLVPAPPGIPDLPPEIPMQAVPTSVTVGPDGAYYVGQLTGFPFPVGGARVFRVVPGKRPQVFARGFTNIIDIAFDRRGRLHVLEIAANGILAGDFAGRLVRVNRDGSRTVLASEGLFAPGGFVIAKDGSIYVTNNGILAGAGQVVRIPPR